MPYIDPRTVNHPFYPVGEIKNIGQIINELKLVGERMEIQAGVMKDWAYRFHQFSEALKNTLPTRTHTD